jgi:hypothetical protein
MEHQIVDGEAFRPFLARAMENANEIAREGGGDFKYIQAKINEADIAMAVWQDKSEPGGVCFLVLKGKRLLRACASSGDTTITAKLAGIPCTDREQAYAIQQVAGEHGALN